MFPVNCERKGSNWRELVPEYSTGGNVGMNFTMIRVNCGSGENVEVSEVMFPVNCGSGGRDAVFPLDCCREGSIEVSCSQ